MKIGIIGNGFVGKATSLFRSDEVQVLIYDKNPLLCDPYQIQLSDLLVCEMIFICVPTPSNPDGSCHTNIVESCIQSLRNLNYPGYIVIRSTVPVGFCQKWNCFFMPEFLTEKNFFNDFVNNKFWIFGTNDSNFQSLASQLIQKAGMIKNREVLFLTTKEAEMVKYFRNCFLATKVAFCNEIHQACQQADIDYQQMKSIACLDERIGSSHTDVPGHDGMFGFGGTCLPKDINSFVSQFQSSILLKSVIQRNENVDRPQKDWTHDKGRASI